MTKLPDIRDRSRIRSSANPSAKYSWSGSSDRFSNGSTTIESAGTGFVWLRAAGALARSLRPDHADQPPAATAIATAAVVAAS
jgi:hypothetical protein